MITCSFHPYWLKVPESALASQSDLAQGIVECQPWATSGLMHLKQGLTRSAGLGGYRTVSVSNCTLWSGSTQPGKRLSTLSSPAILFADHAAPCRKAFGRELLHPRSELRRTHQAGLIETSAKSEVVTVCSWQFAGEERLQSTAMILITAGEPHRCDEHLPG